MPVPECIVSILDFIAERMMEAVVTTGAIRRAKLQSNHHHQRPASYRPKMHFLSRNQQCQSTEGRMHCKYTQYKQQHDN